MHQHVHERALVPWLASVAFADRGKNSRNVYLGMASSLCISTPCIILMQRTERFRWLKLSGLSCMNICGRQETKPNTSVPTMRGKRANRRGNFGSTCHQKLQYACNSGSYLSVLQVCGWGHLRLLEAPMGRKGLCTQRPRLLLAPVQSQGALSTGAIWLKAVNHPVVPRYFWAWYSTFLSPY